jgi:hypothetical protein
MIYLKPENCWICNRKIVFSRETASFYYSECYCAKFNFFIKNKKIYFELYDLINFGNIYEATQIVININSDDLNINIDHDTGSFKSGRIDSYNIINFNIKLYEFYDLNHKDYFLNIIENCKKNLLFI